MACEHCAAETSITWRCPKCGAELCDSCQFTEIDCYDLFRRCPGCQDPLPDTDGSGPADWLALGYASQPAPTAPHADPPKQEEGA